MNGYNFSERVRKSLALSRVQATRWHHEYVGTEHILMGLILEGGGVATVALQALEVDVKYVARNILDVVKTGDARHPTGPDLPYTSRAKKVLELAMTEARDLNHTYVGTEHMLLGLLREEKGVAAQVLHAAGVTLEMARAETLRILGSGGVRPEWTATSPERAELVARASFTRPVEHVPRSDSAADVASVTIEIRLSNGATLREEFHSVNAAVRFLNQQIL